MKFVRINDACAFYRECLGKEFEDSGSIFDFVGPVSKNRIAVCLSHLISMLCDPQGSGRQHLQLLSLKLGDDPRAWPLRVGSALDISLVLRQRRTTSFVGEKHEHVRNNSIKCITSNHTDLGH